MYRKTTQNVIEYLIPPDHFILEDLRRKLKMNKLTFSYLPSVRPRG